MSAGYWRSYTNQYHTYPVTVSNRAWWEGRESATYSHARRRLLLDTSTDNRLSKLTELSFSILIVSQPNSHSNGPLIFLASNSTIIDRQWLKRWVVVQLTRLSTIQWIVRKLLLINGKFLCYRILKKLPTKNFWLTSFCHASFPCNFLSTYVNLITFSNYVKK